MPVSRARRPATCYSLRRARIWSRRALLRSSREPRQRRAWACWLAYTGSPGYVSHSASDSLATVDGERSTLAAILRTLCPAARRQAISHRSSMVTCLYLRSHAEVAVCEFRTFRNPRGSSVECHSEPFGYAQDKLREESKGFHPKTAQFCGQRLWILHFAPLRSE